MGGVAQVAGRPSDPDDYVIRSGARSGHKREFAFALRAQSEAGLPSSRTRSGKSPALSPVVLRPSSSKRPKRSAFNSRIDEPSSDSAISTPTPPQVQEQESVAETPMVVDGQDDAKVLIVTPASTPMVVDGQDDAKPAVPETSIAIYSRRVPTMGIATPERVNRRLTRSTLKASIQLPAAEADVEVGSSLGTPVMVRGDEPALKAVTEAPAVEIPVPSVVHVKSVESVAETPMVAGYSDGSKGEGGVLENGTAVPTLVVISSFDGCKADGSPLVSPEKRLTRSALKGACKDPLAATPCPPVEEVAELAGSLVDDGKGTVVDNGAPGRPDELINVDSGALDKPDKVHNADTDVPVKPNNVTDVDSSVPEMPARRFTRSALKAPLIKQEGFVAESPITKEDNDGCKLDNNVLEKPARRFTRSAIKVAGEDPAMADASETSDGSEGMKSGGNASDGSLRTTPKKKMELKMSKKIALTKLPVNVRELLSTGLLEGYPVKYNCNDKKIALEGVIKGNGILCQCPSCNGSRVFSAFNFEVHAGSTKKHPSDYIFLNNGKSLHDVLKACTSAPLDMLEAAIQNAIGAVPLKRPSICQKCKEPFHTSCTGKFGLLCDLCLKAKQPQTIASPSNGASSNAKLSRTALLPDPCDSTSKNISSHKKNSTGKLTKKDLGLHKLVFMDDILPEGTEVAYYNRGKRILNGYIKDSGIFCLCCNTVVSPSQFEAHAGQASRKKPYNNIYTSNGVSLHELSVSLSKGRKLSTFENDDLCSICADGGDLLLCDLCPRAFHKECVGLLKVPKGDWYCQYCQNMHQREKFVEYNDNAIAAGRVAGVDPIEQIIKRCIRIVTTPGSDVSCCVLCRQHDFSKATFDERTVLICDQCEKEYHVGCLRDHNMSDLKELPEAEWFCCADCSRIHMALQELLLREPEPLQDLDADIIKRKREEKGLSNDDVVDVRWRILSGKTSVADSESLLSKAVSIFHESFDPIVEATTGRDLIPFMVNGENMRDQDFGGIYCVVLTVNSSVISAGTLRILGCEVAELPLVATIRECQGQGYFQSLFSCIERLLGSLKVKHFVLPAADEALSIWTKKFGFTKIATDQLNEYTKGARPMIFQGTSMLHKPVPGSQVSSQWNH